jgi:hypothetical protein
MYSNIRHRIWAQWDPVSFFQRPRPFEGPSRNLICMQSPRYPLPRHLSAGPYNHGSASGGMVHDNTLHAAPLFTLSIGMRDFLHRATHYSATLSCQPLPYPGQKIWIRGLHCSRRLEMGNGRRSEDSTLDSQNPKYRPEGETPSYTSPPPQKRARPSQESLPATGKYLHLPHIPKMPHRPTKEELLAAATGFWSRLKVRFKWFSIRSVRPWNIDDWSAFVSWFVLGNIVWILVGTTTFFSLLIFSINTVVAQGIQST